MTCQEVRSLIEAAVDRKTSQPSAASHLETCAQCREFLTDLQGLRTELAGLREVNLLPVELAAIRAEVLAKLAGRPSWRLRLGWAVVAIAALGSLLTDWNLNRHEPMPELVTRFELPAPPKIALVLPVKQEQPKPTLSASEAAIAAPQPKVEPDPKIWIAEVIPPDPETGSPGGVMLELESRNPKVELYFLADNKGD